MSRRRWLAILAVPPVLVVVLALGGIAYLFAVFPRVDPAGDWTAPGTPEAIERGRYLAQHVAVCLDCHSQRDWDRLSGPLVAGTEGRGSERFGEELGFPGTFHAANITPAGIGDWSDGEVGRVIREGVTRDGRPIFPVMPYPEYRRLCDEDTRAIVAYLRTLAPIEHEAAPSSLNFPMNLIVRLIPAPADPWDCPDEATPPVERGRYLASVGGCIECHTRRVRGDRLPGMDFAGGFEFPLPGVGVVRSANLTSDPETGLGGWTEEEFVARFRALDPADGPAPVVPPGGFQTVMPWTMYAGMTDTDLKALYAFLRSLPPVRNEVATFTAGPTR